MLGGTRANFVPVSSIAFHFLRNGRLWCLHSVSTLADTIAGNSSSVADAKGRDPALLLPSCYKDDSTNRDAFIPDEGRTQSSSE